MQIQVNTDNNIQGREALVARVTQMVQDTLARHADHITRVEVHLTDEKGGKSGPHDQRCVMEARLEGFQPMAVSELATALDPAVHGAAGKLSRMIDSHLGRVRDKRQASNDTPASVVEPTEDEEDIQKY